MVNATLLCFFAGLLLLIRARASEVALTRVYSAVAKEAVCLDGSPPAYHFDKGEGEGTKNWLVNLQGGAWCYTLERCSGRGKDKGGLGSSNNMQGANFSGILSNKKKYNPNFYKWNRILVRYCDGSSFTGDMEKRNFNGKNVYFRGARAFDAIMEDLLEKGMKNASNVLLSGHSAGGLAAILHCDKFRALLPTSVRVKCLSDGGYFLHAKDFYGGYHFEYDRFFNVVSLHGSAKNLPQACTSKIEPHLCFYPQNVVQHIRTPLFILNSVFDTWQLPNVFALTYLPVVGRSWIKCQYNITSCTSSQLRKLRGLGSTFFNTILTRLGDLSSRGLFIDTCYAHMQSLFWRKWVGHHVKLNNKTISEAVGDWFYDRRVVHLVDNKNRLPRWCVYDPNEPSPYNNYTGF